MPSRGPAPRVGRWRPAGSQATRAAGKNTCARARSRARTNTPGPRPNPEPGAAMQALISHLLAASVLVLAAGTAQAQAAADAPAAPMGPPAGFVAPADPKPHD